jgi:uncharacterized LabA/DUF88 family protein
MLRQENNFAFIDGQNLYLGIKTLGWHLDYRKFRRYLREKYGVKKAYLFIGYMRENEALYQNLERADFILAFKPVTIGHDGKIKGNVDADLVLKAMMELDNYHRALIVSGDGDFYSLAGYLLNIGKLDAILSPDFKSSSWLLRETAGKKLRFMNRLRPILEHQ